MTSKRSNASDSSDSRAIVVRQAETHNLKRVDCRVPHGRLTVVTGPSGAGKSSLAFDTIYAEGQRRFVESMSTYARQFLEQMERPPVETIEGVLPSVALEAKNSIKNARSTVGTLTEVQDVLRLLFTHLGELDCPNGHGPVERQTVESLARRLVEGSVGRRFTLITDVARPSRGADGALRELVRQGYGRRLERGGDDGTDVAADEVLRFGDEEKPKWAKSLDPLPLVLGRFQAKEEATSRVQAALEQGFEVARDEGGAVEARGEQGVEWLREGLACPVCGLVFLRPVPPLFSYNSPLGACEECQGFGRVMGIDRERVIPDPSLPLSERPIAPWNSPAYEERYDDLFQAAKRAGVPLDVPVEELSEEQQEWLWSGDDFVNLDRFFRWLERRSYRMHVRVLLARYRAYTRCPECRGARLKPEALAVTFRDRTLPEISAMTIEALHEWWRGLRFSKRERDRAAPLLDQLSERIAVLDRVGLGYLTLDRQARTLSGGETQRIHLASALGSGLTSTLYVLDEPTVGLHARDSEALLGLLQDLAARDNTVLVVEHDPVLVRGADWLIDLGPRAGERGGWLMAEGDPAEVLRHPESLTAAWMGENGARAEQKKQKKKQKKDVLGDGVAERLDPDRLEALPRIEIVGASEHNLKDIDVSFPLGAFVVVTGVSGSGKSTLIENVLYGTHQRAQGVVEVEPGRCRELCGTERVEEMVLVDQRPLGRSTRSNPVTYVKAYDELRKLYARQPKAKQRGITPGHFSFNTDKGRCPECQGTGTIEIDMHFMASVEVRCDTCDGRRFKPEILDVRVGGRSIDQTLELTVDEAAHEFRDARPLVRRLEALQAVGLGYVRLGQSTATLSGGEAQRLKLATFLKQRPVRSKGSKKKEKGKDEGEPKRRLFLFDEPTTGLHLSDIDQLHSTLRQLVERGDGVLVIEHSLELIARADWIVDLGPGGGSHGGELLFSGPFTEFLDVAGGPTVEALRRHGPDRHRTARRS